MSESGGHETLWRITIRDDILVTMATDPEPYWANTEQERDWVLTHLLHRPREDYVAVEVPGPSARAVTEEKERRRALREQYRKALRGSRP